MLSQDIPRRQTSAPARWYSRWVRVKSPRPHERHFPTHETNGEDLPVMAREDGGRLQDGARHIGSTCQHRDGLRSTPDQESGWSESSRAAEAVVLRSGDEDFSPVRERMAPMKRLNATERSARRAPLYAKYRRWRCSR